jgi:hypothetical protein
VRDPGALSGGHSANVTRPQGCSRDLLGRCKGQQVDSTPADTGLAASAYPMCPAYDERTVTACKRENYWNGFRVYEFHVKDGYTCAICDGAPDLSGGSCTAGGYLCVFDCNECGIRRYSYGLRGRLSVIVPEWQ